MAKKRSKRVMVYLRVPPEVRDALMESADYQERSMNGQAVRYLEHCLIREGWMEGEVQLQLLED